VDAARQAACAAAVPFDTVLDGARRLLAVFLDRLGDLGTLGDEAVSNNLHVLPAALSTGLHPSQHPRMASVPTVRPMRALELLCDGGGGVYGARAAVVPSLSAFASSLAPATAASCGDADGVT
jgi:hypothetical protein